MGVTLQCPMCEYDLSGVPPEGDCVRCPECGTDLSVLELSRGLADPPVTSLWKLSVFPGCVIVLVFVGTMADWFIITLPALPAGVFSGLALLFGRIPDRRRIVNKSVRRRVLYFELAAYAVMVMVCFAVTAIAADRVASI